MSHFDMPRPALLTPRERRACVVFMVAVLLLWVLR